MAKIYETTNYALFSFNKINRDIETDRIKESMKTRGWLDPYPMHCVKAADGKIEIKGGHHRFQAAVDLGIPVKYVLSDDNMTLFDIERTTKPWSLRDYIVSRCNAQDQECLELMEYSKRTGIPLSAALSMFWGDNAASGNANKILKQGKFYVRDREHPVKVARIVTTMLEAGFGHGKSNQVVNAISRVVRVPGFDLQRMLQKIQSHPELLRKQPNLQSYLEMLELVYNRHIKGKRTPLVFLSAEISASRNFALRKKNALA